MESLTYTSCSATAWRTYLPAPRLATRSQAPPGNGMSWRLRLLPQRRRQRRSLEDSAFPAGGWERVTSCPATAWRTYLPAPRLVPRLGLGTGFLEAPPPSATKQAEAEPRRQCVPSRRLGTSDIMLRHGVADLLASTTTRSQAPPGNGMSWRLRLLPQPSRQRRSLEDGAFPAGGWERVRVTISLRAELQAYLPAPSAGRSTTCSNPSSDEP